MNGITNASNINIAINGIASDYESLYSGKLSASTFVQFVNTGDWSYPISPESILSDSVDRYNITAYALSDTAVLLLYIADKGSGERVYAVIVTIGLGLLNVGTEVNISGSIEPVVVYPSYYIDADVISSTAFAVAYCAESGGKYHTYAVVCTVAGTTITAGTATQLTPNTQAFGVARIAVLSSTSMLVSTYNSIYSCRLSGTTITKINTLTLPHLDDSDAGDIVAVTSTQAVHIKAEYTGATTVRAYANIINVNSSQTASFGGAVQSIQPANTSYILYARLLPITEKKVIAFLNSNTQVVEIQGTNLSPLGIPQDLSVRVRYAEALGSGSVALYSDDGALSAYTFESSNNKLVFQSRDYLTPVVNSDSSITMLPNSKEIFFVEIDQDLGTMASLLRPSFSGVIPYRDGAVMGFGVAQNTGITGDPIRVITV